MPAGAIVALCLIVIVELVVILMATITFRANISQSYADLEKHSLENLAKNIDSFINMKHLQFQQLDFDAFDEMLEGIDYQEHFDGIAVIDTDKEIKASYKGTSYNEQFSEDTFREFIDPNDINIFTLSKLLPKSAPPRENVLAFKYTIQGDDNVYLVLASFQPLEQIVDAYNFDNVLLVTQGGTILASKQELAKNKTFINTEMPFWVWDNISTSNEQEQASLENTELLGTQGMLAYISINSTLYSEGWRVLSFSSGASMQKQIARQMQAFYVACALVFAVSLAGIGVYAYFYKTRYDERFRAIGLDEKTRPYVLEIDEWGNIKKSNDLFERNFNVENIFSHLVDFGIKAKRIMDNALSFTVKLNDYEQNEHYINFSVIKGHKYSKAIGNESTEQMRDYFSKVESYRKDYYTDLYNAKALRRDFDFFAPSGECLYIQITVPSIKQYVLSFGETFARKIRKSFALRLQKIFADNPRLYYIGDSNYAVIIEGTKEVNSFSVNINDIVRPITQPIKVDDNQVSLSVKMGIAEFNGKDKFKTLPTLWLEAESALQSIKATSNVYAFYRDALATYGDTYFDNRKTLEKIIFSPDVTLYYQPQYNLEGNIVGLEGLCRVENHALRDITTDRFISLVEKNGLIIELSRILYKKAFEFAYAIREKNVVLSLNVSPIQLLQTGFITDFLSLLRRYDLPPRSICLEITENVLMEDFEEVVKKLRILRKNDIIIQLDDFGVNYSSLLYLKELPIDGIKIDRTFIADIVTNEYSRIIVGKIVGIAKELGLTCIVEGVETKEQLDILSTLGDIAVQGWYYSKAQEQGKIGTLLGYDDIGTLIDAQSKEREAASRDSTEPPKPDKGE